MTPRAPRPLPVVEASPPAADAWRTAVDDPGSEVEVTVSGFVPDRGRVESGWTYRFVAEGARAEEVTRLYRELGFEVVEDPVAAREGPRECTECYGALGPGHRAIYTRPLTGEANRG